MDEESNFPKATDQTLLQKFVDNYDKHAQFEKDKLSKTSFGVVHYAGKVIYKIEGFLDKNRDTLRQDILDTLEASSKPFISGLFTEKVSTEEGLTRSASTIRKGASKSNTVGFNFNVSTTPHLNRNEMTFPLLLFFPFHHRSNPWANLLPPSRAATPISFAV